MTTRAVLINVTAGTTSAQILTVLRDHYHKAFSGGGTYPAAGPYTGYGVVYDDIAGNSRFYAKTDTNGNGKGDEIAYVEIGIASGKLYHRIWTDFTGTAGTGYESTSGVGGTWSYDLTNHQRYSTGCTLYFGESFVIYAAADRGFAWFNIKSQNGLQNPACFSGFDRDPGDTIDLSTVTNVTYRFCKHTATYAYVPVIGGVPSTNPSTQLNIAAVSVLNSDNPLTKHHTQPNANAGVMMYSGAHAARTVFPNSPARDIVQRRAYHLAYPNSSVKHPYAVGVDATKACLYTFGLIKAAFALPGTVTTDAVLPSVAAPEYIVAPIYDPNAYCSYAFPWAVPTLYSL